MNTMVRESRDVERGQSEQFVAPTASVVEDADGYLLQVEMPGVNKEALEMWVEDNELTIVGRRSIPAVEGTLLHRESRSENFRRTFELELDAGRLGEEHVKTGDAVDRHGIDHRALGHTRQKGLVRILGQEIG